MKPGLFLIFLIYSFIYCVACKPGYTPITTITNDNQKQIVTSCEIIENCDSSVTLTNENFTHNLCPQCLEGFVYFYNEVTQLIEFNKCTPKISKVLSSGVDLGDNCLAATLDKCKICKKGASFDNKGFCQNFKDNNCEGSFVEFLSNNLIGEIDGVTISYQAIYWANTKTNCEKCRSTFINISYQEDYLKCFTTVERENIVYNSSEETPSARMLQGLKHESSERILENNRYQIVNNNNNKNSQQIALFQTTSIPNCKVVDVIDSSICVVCNENFYLHPLTKNCSQIQNCLNHEFIPGF